MGTIEETERDTKMNHAKNPEQKRREINIPLLALFALGILGGGEQGMSRGNNERTNKGAGGEGDDVCAGRCDSCLFWCEQIRSDAIIVT